MRLISFVLLSAFVAATPVLAQEAVEGDAANVMVVACAIERFCPMSDRTPLDEQFVMMIPDASAVLQDMGCDDLDSVWDDQEALDSLAEFAAGVSEGGEETCLSTADF